MNSTQKIFLAGAVGAALAFGVAVPAFAQTLPTPGQAGYGAGGWKAGMARGMRGVRPAAVGTVSAVNGTTLTIAARGASSTSYTVDASSATVFKAGATTTLSSVAVGDTVAIQGAVSGSSISATAIRDGFMMGRRSGPANGQPEHAPLFKGDGQPVVAGAISSVNGDSIALTTSSGTSYAVDASNAKIFRSGATSTISALAPGDSIVVQGAVNGSSVAATSIMDGPASASVQGQSQSRSARPAGGFFGGIGRFFRGIFGF